MHDDPTLDFLPRYGTDEEANQFLNIKKIKEKILVNSCPINTNSTKQKKKHNYQQQYFI